MEGNKNMKLINSKQEKPLLRLRGSGLQREVILMDEFTWKEILKWSREHKEEQLELPFDK